ncbi:MAG: hypothetical protein SGI99_05560 [Pseudomonadota bacterium]|nr:hypothetical protein [Pseudomonadota bacterium]
MKSSIQPQRSRRAVSSAMCTGALWLALGCASLAQADQVTVDARDFIPIFGNTPFSESSAGNLTCSQGGGVNLFLAQLPLPPVDLDIKQLAIWGGDLSSSDANVTLIRYCQSEFSPSTPATTNIASVDSTGNGGNYFDAATLNRRVDDQQTCIYMLRAQFGLDNCPGNTLSIARVRVRYDVVVLPVVDAIFRNSFEN